MTSRAKLGLSLLGVLLSMAGFYVGNASSFPVVQRLMAPSYVGAKRGIERIQQDGSLQAGDPDFALLAAVVEEKAAEWNKQLPRSAIVLEGLKATGGGIRAGPATSRPIVGLDMSFRGQPEVVKWDLLELSDVVEEQWENTSVRWAALLFWLGVIQTVWPMFLEAKPYDRSSTRAAHGRGPALERSNGRDSSPPSNSMKLTPLRAAGHAAVQ